MAYFILGIPISLAGDPITLRQATVKVISGKQGEKRSLAGSGILFKRNGKSLVLTSEHVILHGEKEDVYWHQIMHQEKKLRAKLIKADWWSGLALLEVHGGKTLPAVSVKVLTRKSRDDFFVRLFGFPWKETRLEGGQTGFVAHRHRHRIVSPGISPTLELADLRVKPGMSGGPVLNDSDGGFRGIISHRYPFIEDSDKIEWRALVIPQSNVSRWLSGKALVAGGGRLHFTRDPKAQLEGKLVVYGAGLRFEPVVLQRRRNDRILLGGGDGVGTGGLKEGVAQNQPMAVHIRAEGGKIGAGKVLLSLRGIKGTVRVDHFVHRQTDAKVGFASLAQFFRMLINPRFQPVVITEK